MKMYYIVKHKWIFHIKLYELHMAEFCVVVSEGEHKKEGL